MSEPTKIHPRVDEPPSFEQLRSALAEANISMLHSLRDMHATMPSQAKMLSPRSLTDAESQVLAGRTDSQIRAVAPLIKPRLVPAAESLRNYLVDDDPGRLLGALLLDARIAR